MNVDKYVHIDYRLASRLKVVIIICLVMHQLKQCTLILTLVTITWNMTMVRMRGNGVICEQAIYMSTRYFEKENLSFSLFSYLCVYHLGLPKYI